MLQPIPIRGGETVAPCKHAPEDLVLLYPASDYITGERFDIADCRACGLTITTPQPNSREIGRYYPSGYYGSRAGKRFPGPVEWLQDRLYAGRARKVEQLCGRPGRVLDVGCGRGLLLEQFRKRGWDVLGVELSEESAAYPRDVLGLPVRVGDLGDLALPSEQYDAIVMWHVLEHVHDPRIALAEVVRLLRPGGVFLVGVPNYGSIEARVCRDKWFHLDVPRHLGHFTPQLLSKQLHQAGLQVRQVSYFAPEYDFFSFVQSALNRMGIRHNLLYNLLRGRGAKVTSEKGSYAQIAATLGLSMPLGAISVPWSLLAAAIGQGATVTAYTTKTITEPRLFA